MSGNQDLDSMEAVLDVMAGAGQDRKVYVGDMVDEIGGNAFGPLMLIPALVAVTPASGIPGLTATCGLIIALVAAQLVFRRKSLWLPGFLRNRSIERSKLETGRDWLSKPARFIDRITAKRLSFLVNPPFDVVPALICLAIGLVMPFMEFIPFSGSIAAGAVGLFALSLVTEDGILALFGTVLVGGLVYLLVTAF
jgi:hypothetical protein